MPAVRAVFFADTHLGFDVPLHPRVDQRRRGEDFFANYERVLRHALETRPDVLIHGGDFFDFSRVAPAIVDRAFLALREVADAGIPVVIAPGNHDRSKLPASLWLAHPNIHTFLQPRTIVLETRAGPCAIAAFAFVRGDVRTAFTQVVAQSGIEDAPAGLRLLCCHHAFDGATVGPHNFVFRRRKDVIAREDIPGSVTAVLSGHIHRAQNLDSGTAPPVFYPGSIERTSFAEREEAKGFLDLAFAQDRGTWRVVEREFLPLPARPMHDITVPARTEPDNLRHYLRRAAARMPDDSVVRVSLAPEAPDALAERMTAAFLRAALPASMTIQSRWRPVDAAE